MGTFITSIHVRVENKPAVIDALRQAKGLPACISPLKNGWVSLFPKVTESQDLRILENLATELARQTKAMVVAFLIPDSDVFRYHFRHGDLRDDYDSDPGFGDGEDRPPSGGNIELVAGYIKIEAARKLLKGVLHKKLIDGEEAVFAEDLMYWVGKHIGIPEDFLPHSWDYLQEELPPGFSLIRS